MTPLVLIPGMMCDARLFAPQIAAFSGHRDLHLATITAFDGMAQLAQSVLENAPPRFALCGLSMGGIVAMEMLRQSPERVDRLALLDTNPLAELEAVKQGRMPQMAAVREGRLEEIMREEMKPNYLPDGPNRGQILDTCMAMATDLGPDVFIRQSLALMNRPDQSKTLRQVDLPTLVLCGREDQLCPVERHELMTDLLPSSTLQVIDGAGHLPTLEKPEETNAALRRWLEE